MEEIFIQGLLTLQSLAVAGVPPGVRLNNGSKKGWSFGEILQDTQSL